MDRYVYVKSDESDRYFPDNKAYKFRVHLSTPLIFDGFWKIALVEFYAQLDNQPKKSKSINNDILYISSDICKESIVQGNEQPVLRRLWKNSASAWNYIFEVPHYLPVKKREITEFEISIKCEDDEKLATFLHSPLYLTLHFKRYPFYVNYESL